MAIPVGTYVTILPFQAAGCQNIRGQVVCCEEKLSCPVNATAPSQEIATARYLVRYMVENCQQCAIHETWFCEFQLLPDPPPVP